MAARNSVDFRAVWDKLVSEFRGHHSAIHGPAHWRRVEANGLKIAAINHASPSIIRLFAMLHDSRRADDSDERAHGELAAEYAATLRGKFFDLDDNSFQLLHYACRWHTHGQISSDPTIGACWDADRLDLIRVGIVPDPDLMSTGPGKGLAARINKHRIQQGVPSLLEEAREVILRSSNSVTRMDKILDYCPLLKPYELGKNILGYNQWLQLLGENWTTCDRITPYHNVLRGVPGVAGPLRSMMDRAENNAYDALTETVTVFRGCDAECLTGLTWTLNKQVANSFPFLTRFKANVPVLIRARAKKSRILAVKLERGEIEIITFSPRRMEVIPADETSARAFLNLREPNPLPLQC